MTTISDIVIPPNIAVKYLERAVLDGTNASVPENPIILEAAKIAIKKILESSSSLDTHDHIGISHFSNGKWVTIVKTATSQPFVSDFYSAEEWNEKQLGLVKEAKKELGWAYITLPDNVLSAMKKIRDKIDSDDLIDDGKEENPHITAKYGLITKDPEEVKEATKNNRGGKVRMGKTSLFSNDERDVLKISVTSVALHNLSRSLSKLENEDTFDEYVPHATLAYLKSGTGKKYTGIESIDGAEFQFDSFMFEDSEKKETKIELNGGKTTNVKTAQMFDEELMAQDFAINLEEEARNEAKKKIIPEMAKGNPEEKPNTPLGGTPSNGRFIIEQNVGGEWSREEIADPATGDTPRLFRTRPEAVSFLENLIETMSTEGGQVVNPSDFRVVEINDSELNIQNNPYIKYFVYEDISTNNDATSVWARASSDHFNANGYDSRGDAEDAISEFLLDMETERNPFFTRSNFRIEAEEEEEEEPDFFTRSNFSTEAEEEGGGEEPDHRYRVEYNFQDGWRDVGWSYEDENGNIVPLLFHTELEADERIRRFINISEEHYDIENFRIIPVDAASAENTSGENIQQPAEAQTTVLPDVFQISPDPRLNKLLVNLLNLRNLCEHFGYALTTVDEEINIDRGNSFGLQFDIEPLDRSRADLDIQKNNLGQELRRQIGTRGMIRVLPNSIRILTTIDFPLMQYAAPDRSRMVAGYRIEIQPVGSNTITVAVDRLSSLAAARNMVDDQLDDQHTNIWIIRNNDNQVVHSRLYNTPATEASSKKFPIKIAQMFDEELLAQDFAIDLIENAKTESNKKGIPQIINQEEPPKSSVTVRALHGENLNIGTHYHWSYNRNIDLPSHGILDSVAPDGRHLIFLNANDHSDTFVVDPFSIALGSIEPFTAEDNPLPNLDRENILTGDAVDLVDGAEYEWTTLLEPIRHSGFLTGQRQSIDNNELILTFSNAGRNNVRVPWRQIGLIFKIETRPDRIPMRNPNQLVSGNQYQWTNTITGDRLSGTLLEQVTVDSGGDESLYFRMDNHSNVESPNRVQHVWENMINVVQITPQNPTNFLQPGNIYVYTTLNNDVPRSGALSRIIESNQGSPSILVFINRRGSRERVLINQITNIQETDILSETIAERSTNNFPIKIAQMFDEELLAQDFAIDLIEKAKNEAKRKEIPEKATNQNDENEEDAKILFADFLNSKEGERMVAHATRVIENGPINAEDRPDLWVPANLETLMRNWYFGHVGENSESQQTWGRLQPHLSKLIGEAINKWGFRLGKWLFKQFSNSPVGDEAFTEAYSRLYPDSGESTSLRDEVNIIMEMATNWVRKYPIASHWENLKDYFENRVIRNLRLGWNTNDHDEPSEPSNPEEIWSGETNVTDEDNINAPNEDNPNRASVNFPIKIAQTFDEELMAQDFYDRLIEENKKEVGKKPIPDVDQKSQFTLPVFPQVFSGDIWIDIPVEGRTGTSDILLAITLAKDYKTKKTQTRVLDTTGKIVPLDGITSPIDVELEKVYRWTRQDHNDELPNTGKLVSIIGPNTPKDTENTTLVFEPIRTNPNDAITENFKLKWGDIEKSETGLEIYEEPLVNTSSLPTDLNSVTSLEEEETNNNFPLEINPPAMGGIRLAFGEAYQWRYYNPESNEPTRGIFNSVTTDGNGIIFLNMEDRSTPFTVSPDRVALGSVATLPQNSQIVLIWRVFWRYFTQSGQPYNLVRNMRSRGDSIEDISDAILENARIWFSINATNMQWEDVSTRIYELIEDEVRNFPTHQTPLSELRSNTRYQYRALDSEESGEMKTGTLVRFFNPERPTPDNPIMLTFINDQGERERWSWDQITEIYELTTDTLDQDDLDQIARAVWTRFIGIREYSTTMSGVINSLRDREQQQQHPPTEEQLFNATNAILGRMYIWYVNRQANEPQAGWTQRMPDFERLRYILRSIVQRRLSMEFNQPEEIRPARSLNIDNVIVGQRYNFQLNDGRRLSGELLRKESVNAPALGSPVYLIFALANHQFQQIRVEWNDISIINGEDVL